MSLLRVNEIEKLDGTPIAGGSGVPTGSVTAFAGSTAPDGWLECNGTAIDAQYTDLIAIVGSNVPDLRGEFIRGWDNGRGVDNGRPNLTAQSDATAANGLTATDSGHAHTYNMATSRTVSDGGVNGAFSQSTNTNTGYANITISSNDAETRPRNVSMMYIIKT